MRNIEIFVNGNFCRKDSNNAGTQGEASVTSLNLTFSEEWAGYAKRIVWRDAKGENPTAILLAGSEQPYNTLIPPEALTEAGWCSFTLEGFLAGSPQDYEPDHIAITATDYLKVAVNDNEYAPAEPTPSQALQLQAEIEELEREIATGGVQKVNGVSPDVEGNVELSPSDIGAYEKPATGIPWQDLKSDVVTSLGKADTAVQPSALSAAIEAAEGTMDTKDAATLSSAKGYADLADNAVKAAMMFYADGKSGAAEQNAKDYADTKAAAAETNAKTYAAGLVTANPSGTATTQLTKLKVGSIVYEVPQGGGGGKTVVTVSGTTPSMSAYDIYRAALSGVVEILIDGFRLPLKYAESSLAAFAGVIESNNGPVLLEVVIDTDAEATSKVLYEVPSGGIPKADLASVVQTSLGKADTAYQKPSSGIPASDLASTVQTSLGKADGAVQKSAQAAKTAGMTNRVGIDENGVLWSVPGGGSGGGATKYTVTLSGSASPYTASMSASEIYTAVQGGNIVEAAFDGEVLALTKSTSSAAIFVGHALTASEFIGLAISISGTTALTTTIPIQLKSIADTAGYFTTDTVEGALAEIGAQLDGIETALDGINDVLEGAL